MARQLKVLIVEDTDSDVEIYRDSILTYNMENEGRYEIEAVYESSKEAGLAKIQELKGELDGAFIDLKLEDGRAVDENAGNEIIDQIYQKLSFPVVVLTGTPAAFDKQRFEESMFLRLYAKGEVNYSELLNQIVSLNETGITRILGKSGLLDGLMTEIFWKHLSKTLSYWIEEKNERTLLRYALTHAIEYLDLDNGKFANYSTAEFYLAPPTKPFIFTGTIMEHKETGNHYVVLSPACDLAHTGKTATIVLAGIEPIAKSILEKKKAIINEQMPESPKPEEYKRLYEQKEEANAVLKGIFGNNYNNKYHFLPPAISYLGGLVNFQLIRAWTPKEIEEQLTPLVLIASYFTKDIIARFSYYYSRQGSPDFDFKKEIAKYLSDN